MNALGLDAIKAGVEGQQEIWWQTRKERVFSFVSYGVFTRVQNMRLLISLFSVMIYIVHICFPTFPLFSYFSLELNCVHVLLFFCYLGWNYLFRAGSTMISDSQVWLSENAPPLFQRMIIIHPIDLFVWHTNQNWQFRHDLGFTIPPPGDFFTIKTDPRPFCWPCPNPWRQMQKTLHPPFLLESVRGRT